MKLASLRHGRDGRLVVVSRDLKTMLPVDGLCPTMQMALDSWTTIAPKLQTVSDALNKGEPAGAIAYDPAKLHAPLPRAYQWCDGSAYLNHVELVRKARNAVMPPEFLHDPLMYQGGSDDFLPPTADIEVADEAYGIDFEGEVAAITGDVPMGASSAEAAKHIRLLMLVNDVSLRNLIPGELAKGFGFFHGKPSTAFAPPPPRGVEPFRCRRRTHRMPVMANSPFAHLRTSGYGTTARAMSRARARSHARRLGVVNYARSMGWNRCFCDE